jgi:hypothetical protein
MALADFEDKAVAAGLIDPKAKADGIVYSEGVLGPHARNAMFVLLMTANGQGRRWEDVLGQLADEGAGLEDLRPPFARAAYERLDPARGEEVARAAIRAELGRDPNGWELAMLGNKLQGDHRAAFEATQDAAYNQWVAVGRAEEEGAEFVVPEEVQGIDYGARFDQFFRDKFGNEIDRAKRTAQVEESTGSLMAGLSRIAGAFEG